MLLLLVMSVESHSQVDSSLPVEPPGVDYTRLSLVAGATAGGFVVGHAILNDIWWKGSQAPFHINDYQDYRHALNADKFGHAYFAYTASTVYGGLARWCGFDSTTATWAGFGIATAYQTYIEIRDGYSVGYGFSWGDIAANTIGSALPLIQHYVPELRAVDLQISFWASEAFKNGAYNAIIDDYTSTTHWLTVNLSDVVPTHWASNIPAWLGVAIGHSVQNVDGQGGGQRQLYLSLDWQFHRIEGLPPWLAEVFRYLHLYHLPAPAVRIFPNVVWYGLRF